MTSLKLISIIIPLMAFLTRRTFEHHADPFAYKDTDRKCNRARASILRESDFEGLTSEEDVTYTKLEHSPELL